MNAQPDRNYGSPLAMPELAKLLGAPIVIQANTIWMLTSGVFLLLTAWASWVFDSPKYTHLYIVGLFSVPVGFVLGYRAKRLKLKLDLDGAQPFRTAIGVAWRTGALWVIVSAIGEYLAEGTTSSTMANFPGMFGLSILAVGSSFLLAYGATAAVIAILDRSTGSLELPQVLNLLIGIGGLIVGVLGLSGSGDPDLEQKTNVQSMAQTTSCPTGPLVPGTEIVCALSAADERLPDGTHYRAFRYNGTRGETITISMAAEEFDAYLILGIGDISEDSFEPLSQNDDGGIGFGTDSRLSYTFEADDTYTVVANTLNMGETGEFTLQVDSKD